MLTSWPAFFFASFDGAGFVTVDKPPVGLWVQAASAKLFGFTLPDVFDGLGLQRKVGGMTGRDGEKAGSSPEQKALRANHS